MNVLSLFDGISGGMASLERAGLEVNNYFASEIDENAIEMSKDNYPNIIQLGNIENINIQSIRNLPLIDLVLAGSPCQGFSRQGKGLSFDDPRSKLFFNFVEILSYVKHFNPNSKFLLENVGMKKEWENVITDYLRVKPLEINSKLVSAQNRPRIYWTDIEGVTIPCDEEIFLNDIIDQDVEVDYVEHQGIKICSSFSEASRELVSVVNGEVRIKQATKKGYIVATDGDGVNISYPTSKSRRGRVINKKSSTLDTSCSSGVFTNGIIRPFTINELEKLQTLPIGYTKTGSLVARKKAIGNGWTIDVTAHILKHLKKEKRFTYGR